MLLARRVIAALTPSSVTTSTTTVNGNGRFEASASPWAGRSPTGGRRCRLAAGDHRRPRHPGRAPDRPNTGTARDSDDRSCHRPQAQQQTIVLDQQADADRAASSLRFPCALKPAARPPGWMRQAGRKGFKIETPGEMLKTYDRVCAWTDRLVAQEWITRRRRQRRERPDRGSAALPGSRTARRRHRREISSRRPEQLPSRRP